MFRRIMVPLDGTLFAETAVATAARIARQHGAELHLVFVNASGGVDGAPQLVDGADYPDDRLQALANTARRTQAITVVTATLRGAIIEGLARYAVGSGADVIMMATHGRTGVSRAVAGSFADDLMHAVHVPLMLLRVNRNGSAREESFRRILVGLDGSPDAEAALTTACAVATAAQATLILAQVVVPVPIEANVAVTAGVVITDPDATQQLVDAAYGRLENLASAIRGRDGIEAEVLVDVGTAVSTIAVAAGSIVRMVSDRKIDLVVLTTRRRRGSRLLLRSVADRVLHETQCALLLCHAPVATVDTAADVSLTAAIDELMTR